MLPLVPSEADTVRIKIEPLLPPRAVPVLRLSAPLTPFVPEFDVLTVKLPLVLEALKPVLIETEPPVDTVLSPALITILPAAPSVPEPTATLMLPAVPDVAEPVRTEIDPVLPELADPVLRDNAPLVDELDVRILNDPLDATLLEPETMDTEPPVLISLLPAINNMLPPLPVLPLPT